MSHLRRVVPALALALLVIGAGGAPAAAAAQVVQMAEMGEGITSSAPRR